MGLVVVKVGGLLILGGELALTIRHFWVRPEHRGGEAVHKLNALGRGVDVADIVAALRFIVATPTLTGQTITIDGGQRFLGLPRDVQFLEPQ